MPDQAIIAKQEQIGLRGITDGEFRRAYWHFDFLAGLDGVEMVAAEGIKFAGVQSKAEAPFVKGKLGSRHHPQIGHFEFLKANTQCTPKMTIPSPSMLHYRGGRKMIDRAAYPSMEDFYRDLGQAYKQAIQGFYAAGCRYLQLDDCSFAYLCDPAQRAMLAQRGDDPAKQGEIYAVMINAALDGRPRDLVVTTHVCRGNFRSTFIASGGYEPIADLLFNGVNVDGYFLEWDNDRAGGFEPLRFAKGQDGGARLGHLEVGPARIERRDQAPHRAGRQVRPARSALPVAAMRLRLHRGRQRAGRGPAMGEAAASDRGRRGGVGTLSLAVVGPGPHYRKR